MKQPETPTPYIQNLGRCIPRMEKARERVCGIRRAAVNCPRCAWKEMENCVLLCAGESGNLRRPSQHSEGDDGPRQHAGEG